jgi:hypothetical protein
VVITMRPGAPVGQPRRAFGPEAADPLVAGRPTDALRLDGRHHRPAKDGHPGHQQLTAKDVEKGSRMSHESLLTVRIFNNPSRAQRLSLVNNVFGDHI